MQTIGGIGLPAGCGVLNSPHQMERARPPTRQSVEAATLEALSQLAAAGAGSDVRKLASLAIEAARRLLGTDAAVVFTWDPTARLLRPLVETTSDVPEPAVAAGEGAIGRCFVSGQPVVVNDYQGWDAAQPVSASRGMRAAMAVPLLCEDRAIGALGVWTYQARAFGPDESRLLTLLAAQLAPALESARLNLEREEQARLFRALHEVAVAASGVHDPSQLAQLAVEHTCELLSVRRAFLWWWDGPAECLRPLADNGTDVSQNSSIRSGEGAAGIAFEQRQPLVIDDYPNWAMALPEVDVNNRKSVAVVPLMIQDRALGVLGVISEVTRHFTPKHIEVLRLLASQVAPAIEAARLLAPALEAGRLAGEGQRQARAFRALHELAVAAGGVLEPARLCQLAAEQAAQLLAADRAVLSLWDGGPGRLRPVADTGAARAGEAPAAGAGEGSAGLAFERRQPVLVDDYETPGAGFGWARGEGFRSALAVPLLAHDQAIGTLCLLSINARHFSAEDVQLASLISAQIGPAIEAAGLHASMAGSERAFRAIHDTAPTSIARNALTGGLLSLNLRGLELFGYDAGDVQGLTRADLIHPDDQLLDQAELAAMVRGELDRYGLERRYLRKDGSWFWGEVTISLVRDSNDVPDFYYAMVEDITERKLAEQALRESEARFRTVFDRAAIGIARLDLEGMVIDANPTLHRLLGRPRASLRGTLFGELLHPDDQAYIRLGEQAAREQADFRVDLRYRSLHGIEVWGNTIVSLVKSPDGDPSFAIVLVEDITVRKVQEVALEHRALHDALTDLPNRSLLQDRLQQAIASGRREQEPGALLVMDLDRFKDVNDAFGHHFGDGLLQQVAVRLRAQLRSSDTVARLGGDEFAIVLPAVDQEGAAQTARKLLDSLQPRFAIEGESFEVGGSIGIALFPEHGDDQDLLMRHADVAMYVAKRSNSGYSFYSTDQDTHSPTRLALMAELREAIDGDRLVAHYQPIVSVSTGLPVGVETLVRWDHPQRGLIYPDQFIPAAEQTGLIRPLASWVLKAAVEQARHWNQAGLALVVSINLSTRNLHDPHLTEQVAALLAEQQVDPGTLQLEITESALMADPEHALRVLRNFADMGLRLAIDDYGTGYSSLAYLRRLPAQELKIDKSFVAEMSMDGNDAVIVRSTIELGHNLGLRVVAEGVEDAATWKLLRECGCDLVQGDYLSRPLPAGAVEAVLRELSVRPLAGER